MTTSSLLVLGIDGGGTKTVAWLARYKPTAPAKDSSAIQRALQACGSLQDEVPREALGRGIAGPGNPRAAGFDVAQANIEAAIEAAFANSRLPRQSVAAACFGLAGCGRPEEQQRIAAWAQRLGIASRVKVTGDAEPVLAAAVPENWGIALICGTGSLAWGRNQRGETARAGGWGYLIGDEGSGYAIALAGLRAAMRAANGRGATTDLLDRFQQQLDAAKPEDLIGRVYAPDMTRERIASLATTVFDAAKTDEVARSVVVQAAHELAEMVSAIVARLSLPANEYPLALAGSVLIHQREYCQRIRQKLTEREIAPAQEVLVSEPVAGAVALARQLAMG